MISNKLIITKSKLVKNNKIKKKKIKIKKEKEKRSLNKINKLINKVHLNKKIQDQGDPLY